VTVVYPGDQTVTEAQHAALAALGIHPENGEELTPEAQGIIDAMQAAQEAAEAKAAEAAQAIEDGEAATNATTGGAPNESWTVKQLDAFAEANDVADYPANGTKPEKLAAIEANGG